MRSDNGIGMLDSFFLKILCFQLEQLVENFQMLFLIEIFLASLIVNSRDFIDYFCRFWE